MGEESLVARLRALHAFAEDWSEYYEYDMASIREAADALERAEKALRQIASSGVLSTTIEASGNPGIARDALRALSPSSKDETK